MTKEIALLVISEMGIGDGLTLIPVLSALKEMKPDLRIEMISPGLYPIAGNFKPIVSIIDPDTPFKDNHDRHAWLASRGYTYVWNTENEKSPWRSVIEAANNPLWISAPPHRTWKRKHILDIRLEQIRLLFPDLSGYPPLTLRLTPEQEAVKSRFASLHNRTPNLIGIHPGAKDRTKIWTLDKFVATATLLSKIPSTRAVFFLHPDEAAIFRQNYVEASTQFEIVEDPLPEAIAKLASCSLFIGNDSGFYHAAYALGLPVIGIYRGPSNKRIWAHPSPRSRNISFYLPGVVRKHWRRFITVDKVFKAAEELLYNASRPHVVRNAS